MGLSPKEFRERMEKKTYYIDTSDKNSIFYRWGFYTIGQNIERLIWNKMDPVLSQCIATVAFVAYAFTTLDRGIFNQINIIFFIIWIMGLFGLIKSRLKDNYKPKRWKGNLVVGIVVVISFINGFCFSSMDSVYTVSGL